VTISIANTEISHTFDAWRIRTNEMATAMRDKVVTADSNVTTGNVVVHGTISSNSQKVDIITPYGAPVVTVNNANLVISSSSGLVTQAPVDIQSSVTFQTVSNMFVVGANASHQYLAVNNSTNAVELRELVLDADGLTDFDISNVAPGARSNSSIITWNTAISKWVTGSLSFLAGASISDFSTNNIIGINGTINLTSNCIISNTMWTFTNNNRVGINTSSPIAALHVNGAIVATGDIQAFQTSDSRFKLNIEPIRDGLAFEVLDKLKISEFDWDPEKVDTPYAVRVEGHDVGLIAQQVQEVMPEIVATRPDGTLAVNYFKLIPYLVAAVQDLKAQVEELKNGR